LVVSIPKHIGLFQPPFSSVATESGPWVLCASRDRLLRVIESVQILIYPRIGAPLSFSLGRQKG
jgi:hypothetical protein